jgi:hypothetical protein
MKHEVLLAPPIGCQEPVSNPSMGSPQNTQFAGPEASGTQGGLTAGHIAHVTLVGVRELPNSLASLEII